MIDFHMANGGHEVVVKMKS